MQEYVIGGSVVAFIAAAIGMAVKASKARVSVSGDTLQILENRSQGGWITELELKLIEANSLRLAAEKRERETREAHLGEMLENGALKQTVRALSKKVAQLERRMSLISDLLIIERPDLAKVADLFRASEFHPGEDSP